MNEDPLVESRYTQWAQDRRSFNQDLHIEGSDAYNQQWQKDYFRGEDMWVRPPQTTERDLNPVNLPQEYRIKKGNIPKSINHPIELSQCYQSF